METMLKNTIHSPEELPIENISSPINAQMFEFYDYDLFPENLQNSEVSSSSNCCYDDNSSYTTNLSFASLNYEVPGNYRSNNSNDNNICNNDSANNNENYHIDATIDNNLASIIFDSQEENKNNNNNTNNIMSSVNSYSHPTFPIPQFITPQDNQFDISSLHQQIPLTDVVNGFSPVSPEPVGPFTGTDIEPPLSSSLIFEDNCLSSLPSYVNLDPSSPSCSFFDPSVGSFMPTNFDSSLSGDGLSNFTGVVHTVSELQPHDLEFEGDSSAFYVPDPQIFTSTDIQSISNESQQLVNGGGISTTPLVSEITTLEESTYKVGRLSVEERKEKIHRYMKKRNQRNFSKKIKYACRKTLADSRPRVRGRFAKNDEFGEIVRPSCSNLEDEDDEVIKVVGKVEEETVDSSDIFAHISGVNSFKCNYPLQSWI